MNQVLQNKLESQFIKKTPEFNVGDTIAVTTIIREGDKQRNQVFKGLVIAVKREGVRKTFTIRKISSGVGVEKIFPLSSPNIEKIEVIKRGAVRKSKIYYMRKRIGKKALKVNEKSGMYESAEADRVVDTPEEVVETIAEATSDNAQSA
jgi:large subunit ribosomal protein L19